MLTKEEAKKLQPPETASINDQWHFFAKVVLPAHCSETQRREMKRAFFAGADVMLNAPINIVDKMPEAAVLARIKSWQLEARGYLDSIIERQPGV